MKALFNGECYECHKLKPKCTTVVLKDDLPNNHVTLCPECRADLRGQFTIHDKHRSPSEMMPKESEAKFTVNVLKLANLYGWRSIHIRPAMVQSGGYRTPYQGDGKGFPDLLLLRRGCSIAAELKADPNNHPTIEQIGWLEAFHAAGSQIYVWRPENWNEIERILSEDLPQSDEEAEAVLLLANKGLPRDGLSQYLGRSKRRNR